MRAAENLLDALERAKEHIRVTPQAGLLAPRPYPRLTQQGRLWIKAGRYWIAWRTEPTPTIVAVFFETANIPGHL